MCSLVSLQSSKIRVLKINCAVHNQCHECMYNMRTPMPFLVYFKENVINKIS